MRIFLYYPRRSKKSFLSLTSIICIIKLKYQWRSFKQQDPVQHRRRVIETLTNLMTKKIVQRVILFKAID